MQEEVAQRCMRGLFNLKSWDKYEDLKCVFFYDKYHKVFNDWVKKEQQAIIAERVLVEAMVLKLSTYINKKYIKKKAIMQTKINTITQQTIHLIQS